MPGNGQSAGDATPNKLESLYYRSLDFSEIVDQWLGSCNLDW